MAVPDTLVEPVPFPGGLADTSWKHACVRYGAGQLMAVDLDAGATLWRTTEAFRPLLATTEELIAADDRLRCAVLTWDATGRASPRWTSDVLPLPDWARAPDAELVLGAQMRGDCIEIAWTAGTRYKGGAAPSAQVLAGTTRDASGAFAVDRATGAVTPLAAAAPLLKAELPALPASDPHVLQHARHADRIYELGVERDVVTVRTVLRALDTAKRKVWQLVVDEQPARPPRARRA